MLKKYEEVETLVTSYEDMICGKANQQREGSSDYYLQYWLSSADESYDKGVWILDGESGGFDMYECDQVVYFGVRPIITVTKSSIS